MEWESETAWNSARLTHMFSIGSTPPTSIFLLDPAAEKLDRPSPPSQTSLPASSCKPLRRTTVQWRRVRVQPEKPSQSWQSLTPAGHLTVFFQGPGPFFTTCAAREMVASPTLPVMPPHTFFFTQRASPVRPFPTPPYLALATADGGGAASNAICLAGQLAPGRTHDLDLATLEDGLLGLFTMQEELLVSSGRTYTCRRLLLSATGRMGCACAGLVTRQKEAHRSRLEGCIRGSIEQHMPTVALLLILSRCLICPALLCVASSAVFTGQNDIGPWFGLIPTILPALSRVLSARPASGRRIETLATPL
jgi:hypothetical protein